MFLFALLFACKAPEGCVPGADPTVEVGVGVTGFVPHTDGDDGVLVFGPQGGYHLTLAVETTGFQLSDEITGVITGTIGDEEVASTEPFIFLRCDNQTASQKAWDFRLPFVQDPATLDGEMLTVDFTVTDGDGRTAVDQAVFALTLQ